MHFPNSFRLVPRRSQPEEAELVLCQRLSLIKNMASVETDGSSTVPEVRYTTNCHKYYIFSVFVKLTLFKIVLLPRM